MNFSGNRALGDKWQLEKEAARPRDRIGRYAFAAYVVLLLVFYVGDRFSGPPARWRRDRGDRRDLAHLYHRVTESGRDLDIRICFLCVSVPLW